MRFVQVTRGRFLARSMDLIWRSKDTIINKVNGHTTPNLKFRWSKCQSYLFTL